MCHITDDAESISTLQGQRYFGSNDADRRSQLPSRLPPDRAGRQSKLLAGGVERSGHYP